MSSIKVWHRTNPTFMTNEFVASDFPQEFTEVGTVLTPDLDEAYASTQNRGFGWHVNCLNQPTEAVRQRGGCRSTSVGDVLEVFDGTEQVCTIAGCDKRHGTHWLVESIGFRPL